MGEEISTGKTEVARPSRRDVVTKAAQVAVTAPAVAVLLNAYAKNAFAQPSTYDRTVDGIAAAGDNATPGDNFISTNQTGDDFSAGDDFVAGTYVDDQPFSGGGPG